MTQNNLFIHSSLHLYGLEYMTKKGTAEFPIHDAKKRLSQRIIHHVIRSTNPNTTCHTSFKFTTRILLH
jgi:UDP-N-acetylglucosamine pyrophosphorylase